MKHWAEFTSEVREQARPKGTVCGVTRLLSGLHKEAQDAVLGAIADESLTAPAISRALKARVGAKAPSSWTIANHRRGGCGCEA